MSLKYSQSYAHPQWCRPIEILNPENKMNEDKLKISQLFPKIQVNSYVCLFFVK